MSDKKTADEATAKDEPQQEVPQESGAVNQAQEPESSDSRSAGSSDSAAASDPAANSPAVNSPTARRGLHLLVSLLALLALVVSGGVAWLAHQQAEQTSQQLLALQQQVESQPTHQQLDAALQPLQLLETQQQQQQQQVAASLHQYHLQLEQMQQALLKAAEPRPRDWLLAEVEYLLRLANQRLQLEEDVQGALTLFKTADQRLKQADVPGTLAVRARLLEDIEALRNIHKIDRVSLALELQEMADQALALKVYSLPVMPALSLDRVVEAENLRWYEALWLEIRSLVVVRKRELPIQSLPFTEDELALRHQLSALLQQAAWAALRGEEPLYQASLERAWQRLEGFDPELESTRLMQQQLTGLREQSVSRVLPNIQSSLDALQTFIAQRYGVPLPVSGEEAQQGDAP
ncbi:uroporphyrinogen-III C-methyltransferase [Marinospirillum alkaliphilum]|uniref:Uroporphyrin-3 C-methyltransferase n=1 Tax=Marinospirillum alkaliphilum DSM 21637 TaxID=1122209 RepID=A0A1K1WSH9_9GAMM|nr:uroporphyrinogen-III C-methyltransferase [Marinospirillum alkaliphilum]SFX40362.1 uroporphyrin-3 C-methyltransferase [Marinospirillum alkaliphilum DSM 21637]